LKPLPSDDNERPTPTATIESDQLAEVEKRMKNSGKLILDATVAPQAIRYPTDLNLLNEVREISEQVIDKLYPATSLASPESLFGFRVPLKTGQKRLNQFHEISPLK